MKRRMIVGVMVGLMTVSGMAWAGARDGKGPGGQACGRMMKGFGVGPGGILRILQNEDALKQAGVTEEQIGQLQEIAYQGRVSQVKGHADLQLAHMELQHLLDGSKPTQEAADKAIDKISALEAQLQKARVAEMLKVREIIGEDKIAKLKDAMQERMRERRAEREKGRGEGRRAMGPPQGDGGPGNALPADSPDDPDEGADLL